jgi:hypothetical protein
MHERHVPGIRCADGAVRSSAGAGQVGRGAALHRHEGRDEVPRPGGRLEALLAGGVPVDLHGQVVSQVVTHARLVVRQ